MQINQLINMNHPNDVYEEIKHLLRIMYPQKRFQLLSEVFPDILSTFDGKFPGYRRCNTEYHDLQHTMDATLALVRLLHGLSTQGNYISDQGMELAIISALFHDTGYIQEATDTEGTGAKYTSSHEKRSIEFAKKYFEKRNLDSYFLKNIAPIIRCTDLKEDIEKIRFESKEIETIGKALAVSDLIGQMASRYYLEKLFFLYLEFEEGQISVYQSEYDLFQKTPFFFKLTQERFNQKLNELDKYMGFHFVHRWNLTEDLYKTAMNNNLNYLLKCLQQPSQNIKDLLRRGGLIKKLQKCKK